MTDELARKATPKTPAEHDIVSAIYDCLDGMDGDTAEIRDAVNGNDPIRALTATIKTFNGVTIKMNDELAKKYTDE